MTFLDDLKKHADARNAKKNSRARFLALKEHIRDALSQGYSAKDIWQYCCDSGQIEIPYRTFTSYVKRYINDSQAQCTAPVKTKKPKDDTLKKFSFDPIPDREKLI